MMRLAMMAIMVSVPAWAQGKAERPPTQVVDFSTVDVIGELMGPPTIYVKSTSKVHFRNLIELRGSFKPELKRSASAL
jgi:hypothetical protein